jgi:hypothetical protein
VWNAAVEGTISAAERKNYDHLSHCEIERQLTQIRQIP